MVLVFHTPDGRSRCAVVCARQEHEQCAGCHFFQECVHNGATEQILAPCPPFALTYFAAAHFPASGRDESPAAGQIRQQVSSNEACCLLTRHSVPMWGELQASYRAQHCTHMHHRYRRHRFLLTSCLHRTLCITDCARLPITLLPSTTTCSPSGSYCAGRPAPQPSGGRWSWRPGRCSRCGRASASGASPGSSRCHRPCTPGVRGREGGGGSGE